jgi:N-methylhydantoinase B
MSAAKSHNLFPSIRVLQIGGLQMAQGTTRVNPVTFEVLRNKLNSIVTEQTITLKNVSGSPIVTEAADFNNGIYLADGTAAVRGQQIIMHASSVTNTIKNILADYKDNPGINKGDMFFANDPWKGAPHQSDVAVVAPLFYQDELILWTGSIAHELDVGGMMRGSWCPTATEKYQEGMALPPIKLVERGSLRKDVWEAILAHSRLPFLLALDLKAMIACNNVGNARLLELMERYGLDTVKAVLEGLIEQAEQGLRRRLKELPDGVYRGVNFLDHDGHQNRLYKVIVTVRKEGDTLTFDFTGSSKQAPGYVNCTEVCMIGGTATPLFITLGFDLPWNGGLLKPIRILGPEGIICNATAPAPVSGAPVSAGRVVMNACTLALSRLMACSDRYIEEARAVTTGTFVTLNLAGVSQYGERYGTMILDPNACGESAYSFRDGVDAQGSAGAPKNSIPNVESNEDFAPLLYLHRRIVQDTGGPGKYRGGCTAGLAFVIHDADTQEGVLVGHGAEVPNDVGIFGGLPGSSCFNTIKRGTDILRRFEQGEFPGSIDELPGEKVDLGAKPGAITLSPGDVFEYSWQGGGGWADPLEREPQRVLDDVVNGTVSLDCAERVYGVTIDSQTLHIDNEQTSRTRNTMRQERLAKGGEYPPVAQLDTTEAIRLFPMGEYLELIDIRGRKIVRCRCGYQFGPPSQNWKECAIRALVPPDTAGPHVRLHEELEMRQFICPSCGVLLSTEVSRKGDPPLWEIELHL